jgi:DNA-binding XRE family transcriptional regulator
VKNTNQNNNLRLLRVKYGNTQKDIAKMLQISTAQYAKKENGKAIFKLSEAKILSDYFKIAIEEIFFADNVYTTRMLLL